MYLEYFALQRHPFRITPDPTLFCPGGGRGEILEALIYAITSGEGIIKVVGEVGSGKTMLCRILEERLPKTVDIVYLANPKLTPHDILYAIAFELKLPVQPETERLVVMQHLQAYLLGQHAANRSVVAFIEEAQGMPLETLEEIRLLSNLETHRHKLLQIVLFGQPELEKNLRKRDIRQLKERITHSFHLGPLTTAETSEYMRFRLQAAGCGKSGVFSPGAERLIAKVSCGLIRRINILADKAMLAAYADPGVRGGSSSRAMVQVRHVRAAVRDSEFRLPFYQSPWFAGAGVLALVVGLLCVGGWFFGWGQWLPGKSRLSSGAEPPVSAAAGALSPTGENKPVAVPVAPEQAAVKPAPEPGKDTDLKASGDQSQVAAAGGPGGAALPPAETSPVTNIAPPLVPAAPAVQVASPPADGQSAQSAQAVETEAAAVTVVAKQTSPEVIAKSDETLLAQRRKASREWLRKIGPDSYTIQLMTVDRKSEIDVERLLRQANAVAMVDMVYVCQVPLAQSPSGTGAGDEFMWVLVYGEYPGVTPARKAIDSLPRELRRFQPYVRRAKDVLCVWGRDGVQG